MCLLAAVELIYCTPYGALLRCVYSRTGTSMGEVWGGVVFERLGKMDRRGRTTLPGVNWLRARVAGLCFEWNG